MKIKRLICFVMAFAMMLGTLSIAVAAVTAKSYSKTNCGGNFVTSNTVGKQYQQIQYDGVSDMCSAVIYQSGTKNYHYSAICEPTGNYSELGPYVAVAAGHTGNLPFFSFGPEYHYQLKMKVENAIYHESNHANSSNPMDTSGSFFAIKTVGN